MKKLLIAASLCSLASAPVMADRILGVFVGASQWNQNYEGSIRDLDSAGLLGESIDLENDLGFDDEDGNVIYIKLEHPIPALPNIRIQQTELEIDASGEFEQTINFGDEEFFGSVDINSELDLSHTDATFYWQILDNAVSLDLGITARWFEGDVNIEQPDSGTTAEEKLDAVIPLLYIATRFDLPLSGLYAGLEGNFLGDGDNNFIDYQATIGYESSYNFGIEAGFRSLELDLDDVDDIEADITVDGAFIGLFFHL